MSHSITRVRFRNQRDYHCAYFPEELTIQQLLPHRPGQLNNNNFTLFLWLAVLWLLYCFWNNISLKRMRPGFTVKFVSNSCLKLQVGPKLSRRLITFEWFPLAIFEHLDDIVLWRKPYSYDWGPQTQNAKPTPTGSFDSHLDIQREPVQ